MAKPIPKWVMNRLSVLWKKFGNKELRYEDIENTLKIDDKNTISVFLNELKRADWIEIKLDKEDTRRRLYILKSPNEVIGEIDYNVSKRSKG